jgi:Protein of unknown function (DUF1571)
MGEAMIACNYAIPLCLACLIPIMGYSELAADEPRRNEGVPLTRPTSYAEPQFAVNPVDASATNDKLKHPVQGCLQLAREALERIDRDIRDYTCLLVKRERINGQLGQPEKIFVKVRHKQIQNNCCVVPFAVYMKFLAPEKVQGREVLFVRESAKSPLLVRNGGRRLAYLTLSLDPNSRLAMIGNRYPITEFGIKRLTERMIDLGSKELGFDECEVAIQSNVSFDDGEQRCTCIEVKHPAARSVYDFHIARVYIDDALQIPVRFESYDWPASANEQALLKEEYTYTDLKVNIGLTEEDFNANHPSYGFR